MTFRNIVRSDTIAAIATPPGEGGIAIIRISGPEAISIASQLFVPEKIKTISKMPGYSICYGRVVDPETDEEEDDGLLTIFRAPHSYTGEDTVEISCHGGRAGTSRILRLTLDAGARAAEPGEFTMRAFLNGRIDLAQAEAVADLIRARSESARREARRQLDGSLSKEVAGIRNELEGIIASIEVTIDFSEEVGELDYDATAMRITSALGRINQLISTSPHGLILREGLRVAIVGRPNVGKSTLMNALLRSERAIVTDIAGTTRDLLEDQAMIGGISVVLIDTAGIRETVDRVEEIGVRRARQAAESADLILLVIDGEAGFLLEDEELGKSLRTSESGRLIVAVNKSDITPPERMKDTVRLVNESLRLDDSDIIPISAISKDSFELLESKIADISTPKSLQDDTVVSSVVVMNIRHARALEEASESLSAALGTAQQQLPGDFISIDIRGGLDALGAITGETVQEDIIHRIFHDFCVGK